MTDFQQANIQLRGDDAELIANAAVGHGARGFRESVQFLIAEGLRSLMTQYRKPINKGYLDATTSWANILQIYREFEDAISRDMDLPGPLGSTCRFVPVPDESRYSEPGRQTFIVLPDKFDIGPDCEAILRRDTE